MFNLSVHATSYSTPVNSIFTWDTCATFARQHLLAVTMTRQVVVGLLFVLLCAGVGLAKEHEVLWDVPADGLQLASISTAKCGDTIRFWCPPHVTNGLYKLDLTNYNGTCPTGFDQPMIGESLYEPKKGCDFTLKLEDGPDFYVTSQIPGVCQQNLKVYVHTVCIKSGGTFVSSMLDTVPIMSSLRHRFSSSDPAAAGSLGLTMAGDGQPTLGASHRSSRRGASGAAVMEAAKQSSAAGLQPLLATLLLAAGMAAAFL